MSRLLYNTCIIYSMCNSGEQVQNLTRHNIIEFGVSCEIKKPWIIIFSSQFDK